MLLQNWDVLQTAHRPCKVNMPVMRSGPATCCVQMRIDATAVTSGLLLSALGYAARD